MALTFGKPANGFRFLDRTAKACERKATGGKPLKAIVVYHSNTGNTGRINLAGRNEADTSGDCVQLEYYMEITS